jgi:hypothetical protein
MHQAKEGEIRIVANAFGIEARKQGRRCGAIETLIVEENPDVQR